MRRYFFLFVTLLHIPCLLLGFGNRSSGMSDTDTDADPIKEILELVDREDYDREKLSPLIDEALVHETYADLMILGAKLYYLYYKEYRHGPFLVELLEGIKKRYAKEWDADWKNDALLSIVYEEEYRAIDVYETLKKLIDRMEDPPFALLLLMSGARCDSDSPMTDEEEDYYILKAVEKRLTFASAIRMRSYLDRHPDEKESEKWEKIIADLEHIYPENVMIVPEAMKSVILCASDCEYA